MDMKDSGALTLFRHCAAFWWRAAFTSRTAAAIGVVLLASSGATAAEQTVFGGAVGCQILPDPVVFPDPVFLPPGSPAPVVMSGGSATGGGAIFAGPTVRAATHAGARAPNAPASTFGDCGAKAQNKLADVVIQGPAGFVPVRMHLPFHANIHQDFTEMTDGVNKIVSNEGATVFLSADLGGFGRAQIEFRLNRQGGEHEVFPGDHGEFVPRPRIPGLVRIDDAGFITQFFQLSQPVTAVFQAQAFAGFRTITIDELRGEIILVAQVPANTALPLFLTLDLNTKATANFIASGFGSISEASLGVPADGSIVFELPEGYTAQAPSAGVIDNVVPQVFKCTQTAASWRSHPGDWPLGFMTLGGALYTRDDLLGILQLQPNALRPDASVVLAQQLIAARLNEANGSAPGPMLLPSSTADSLLAPLVGRVPARVNPATATGQQMMNIAIVLNNYNTGRLTPVCVP